MRNTFLLVSIFACVFSATAQKVQTSYLWHMDQPIYWADKSKDKPESKQFAEESQRLKFSGGNLYIGSSVAHPTNDLQDIFSKADRVQAYQNSPRNAVSSIKDLANAGAQLSISAGLMENIQSLGAKNQWGYGSGWMNGYKEAIGWKTSGNFPRLDVVGFTYDHALSPLVSDRTLVKQIQAHQYASNKYYGYVSKGYWPAECAFTERIIKSLATCGIEWSVVANSHLARTLSDYVHPYNINGNIEAPNKADIVAAKGTNWYEGTIDGRGSRLAAPYCYQAHKAQYIDPATGTAYKIDVVPMCNYISYIDGYSGANVSDISTKIEPYSDASHPSLVLLAHDGDNAWGGGSSYYNEAVTSFTHAAANAGYKPTTIQQFLKDNPVPANDMVHVEDGAWVNADSDWGHPQYINWLWPLYSKTNYRFDPNGWTEDARNWAVITATENYVTMAEDLEGGNLRIEKIADGGTTATNAEKAWHFYFGGLNSGFMYYGKAEDMEVKASMTGNIAIDYAKNVINSKQGVDNTAPSVFIPQRFPYNPGSTGFGPTTGYKKINYSSDFDVWTFAYDVSGLANITLKYRTDKDGINSEQSSQNETYAGGSEVDAWQDIAMTRKPLAADPTADPELNFFILPQAKADLCYAEIKNLKDTLVDYYVEAIDTKGNIFRSPIQHVYVGNGDGNNGGTTGNITWTPTAPTSANTITIVSKDATASSKLHWGVNNWTTAIAAYQPTGTTASTGGAVETPFTLVNGVWQVMLGPFNNPTQAVSKINFVINHGSSWDNNGGSDYLINVSAILTDNPLGQNINKNLLENETYTFVGTDFGFSSPKSNTFKGIRIISLPSSGSLKSGSTSVSVGDLITGSDQFTFTAGSLSASFSFKIIDSGDLESDATYTATFTIGSINPPTVITVSFKKPTEWGTSGVNLWAWTGTNTNLFPSWPGVSMTDNGNGVYSYTFAETVTNVNAIFSKNGSPQTVDISAITASTCYEQSGLSGNKLTVKTVDCTSNIQTYQSLLKMNIYPQPATTRFAIELPNIASNDEFQLNIYDMNGKIVRKESFSGNQFIVDRGTLKSGLYLVRITNEKSGIEFSSKLSLK
ncbi:MAG: starch-binding protein [Bacteroidales bacterium]|nr:starch-binding protein [Bacteroidales bacterium]